MPHLRPLLSATGFVPTKAYALALRSRHRLGATEQLHRRRVRLVDRNAAGDLPFQRRPQLRARGRGQGGRGERGQKQRRDRRCRKDASMKMHPSACWLAHAGDCSPALRSISPPRPASPLADRPLRARVGRSEDARASRDAGVGVGEESLFCTPTAVSGEVPQRRVAVFTRMHVTPYSRPVPSRHYPSEGVCVGTAAQANGGCHPVGLHRAWAIRARRRRDAPGLRPLVGPRRHGGGASQRPAASPPNPRPRAGLT